MAISRMDLADAGSPEKLVSLILKGEPDLPPAVPIEELCRKLDIEDFQDLTTDGFEGGLLTDIDRSFGIILLKTGFEARRRFTMAHELGHFLMPSHIPDQSGRFLCSKADMQKLASKEGDRRSRMEVEANRFASLLLIPPPALRQALKGCQEPDLQHIPKLARDFCVSKEAMARAYAQYHDAGVAIVVTQHGKILRSYKAPTFPFIVPTTNSPVPAGSYFHRQRHEQSIASDVVECTADLWIDVRRGERAPKMYEQFYPQQEGFALILLQMDQVDEDAEQEDREIDKSWEVGFGSKRKRR